MRLTTNATSGICLVIISWRVCERIGHLPQLEQRKMPPVQGEEQAALRASKTFEAGGAPGFRQPGCPRCVADPWLCVPASRRVCLFDASERVWVPSWLRSSAGSVGALKDT
jgi:hypothetical protein